MTVQAVNQTPISFKRTDSNVIPFNNGYMSRQMPDDFYQEDMFVNQMKAIRRAEKKEKSRERWNKANVIFSGMIGVGVLGSLIAMMLHKGRGSQIVRGAGGESMRKDMGDASVKFKELVKDSLPKLDGESVNPKTRDFITMVRDRLALKPEIAKYAGSKAAERCLLIYGPTGTGKTFSARLLANELGAEYAEIDFPKIASPYVGQASSNIRQVFENTIKIAKEHPEKKYLLAFNEIDSMLIPMGHATADKAHILENRTAFLNGLDMVKEHQNITIVGTTNANPKSGNLDFAALGRFGNIFEIGLPTEKEIIASLKWHMKDCEGAMKHDFFNVNKIKLESFAKKLHNKKYSQRDIEKLADNAQTRFAIDIAGKPRPLEEKFDIKYLEEALKSKGETTGEMQAGIDGKNIYGTEKAGFFKRLMTGLLYAFSGGK